MDWPRGAPRLAGIAFTLTLSLAGQAVRGAPEGSAAMPLYETVTAEAGIRHRHVRPVLDAKLTAIMPWMTALGAAACTADYDRNGRLDLYLGNYFRYQDLWHLEDTRIMHDSFETSRNGGVNQLFRQGADGSFTDVAREAGVGVPADRHLTVRQDPHSSS